MGDLVLCTQEDVAQALRNSAPTDLSVLDPYIDEATDYIKRVLRLDFHTAGTQVTEEFYDVREQSRLRLHELQPLNPQVTVTMIANTLPPFIDPWVLTENNDFVIEDDRYVRITSSMFFRVIGYDYAYGKRSAITWDRVTVTYLASGYLPPTIHSAAQLLAAAMYKQTPYDAAGFNSEHMGDYGYERAPRGAQGDPVVLAVPLKVRALLRLWRGTKSRST